MNNAGRHSLFLVKPAAPVAVDTRCTPCVMGGSRPASGKPCESCGKCEFHCKMFNCQRPRGA